MPSNCVTTFPAVSEETVEVQSGGQLKQRRKTLCNRSFWRLAVAESDENEGLVTLTGVADRQHQHGSLTTKASSGEVFL
jgi:hypothetical protein